MIAIFKREIRIASGRKSLVLQSGGGLDECVAENVGHLGGKGNHFVMLFRRCDGEKAEMTGFQCGFYPV